MKRHSPFAAFERGLLLAHRGQEDDARERLGIEPEKPKRGRPKKCDEEPVVVMSRDQWNVVKLPDELAAQVERIADEVGINRTGLARLLLAAGLEAVLIELESGKPLPLPLILQVSSERRSFFDCLRSITPERFAALCSRHPWPLAKWKLRRPSDQTGTPMPPPAL